MEPQPRQEILDEAAREQRRITLTHHGADGWRLFKGALRSEAAQHAICVEAEFTDEATARALASGQMIGGTFRAGHKKCMFSARIESVSRQGDRLILRLSRPGHLQQLQRRAYERATPPAGAVIAVRFWRDIQTAPDRKVRHGQLEDISAGGLRIKVADVSELEMEASYRCVFTPRAGKPAFVLDGLLRHRAAIEQGRASLGFQFVGLEATDEGRQTLTRLARFVNQLHRARQRRNPRKTESERASSETRITKSE